MVHLNIVFVQSQVATLGKEGGGGAERKERREGGREGEKGGRERGEEREEMSFRPKYHSCSTVQETK